MFSLLPMLSLNYARAIMGRKADISNLPSGWINDDKLRRRVPAEERLCESQFMKQMRTLYSLMDGYNAGKRPFQQVHLVLRDSEAEVITKERYAGIHYTEFGGFGFLTRGKIHNAYYLDMHEDIGFRVFEGDKPSHAYLRTYKATPEDFENFIRQAVFQTERNPRLSYNGASPSMRR